VRQRLARLRALRAVGSETRGLVSDSFVLTIATAVETAGQMVQIALITNFVGLGAYGQFALVVASVAIASQFFDVQVPGTAVAYAATTRGDGMATAGIFRFSYLVDMLAGLAGYAIVAALAPFVAARLVGGNGATLFLLYGITLLTASVETTSLAVLQFLGRFPSILWLTVFREVMRVALLVGFFVKFDSLTAGVVALVIVEAAFVLPALVVSGRAFRRRYSTPLLRSSAWPRRDVRRAMLRMLVHTNFITYAKLVSSQAPTILLGAFRSPVEVGAFKVAMALAAGVGKPAEPASAAVLPRLSRLWGERRFSELRSLLVESTLLAFGLLATVGGLVFLFRSELTRIFAGGSTPAAFNVLLLAIAAQVVGGTLFWNSDLLFAARRADRASWCYASMALLLAILLPVLIWQFGAIGAAAALLIATVAVNLMLTFAAISLFRSTRAEVNKSVGLAEAAVQDGA
jgi:O-antigen/teichoic acid export membrane protein